MESAHQDNWLSHWHPNEGVALISLHDWSSISEIARSPFAAYEMILHGLRAASYEYEPTRFMYHVGRVWSSVQRLAHSKQLVELGK